jgi:hypothetical protein
MAAERIALMSARLRAQSAIALLAQARVDAPSALGLLRSAR